MSGFYSKEENKNLTHMTPEELHRSKLKEKEFELTESEINDLVQKFKDKGTYEFAKSYHSEMMGKHYNENNNKQLRDEFAMSVLNGELSCQGNDSLFYDREKSFKKLIDKSYKIADGMIERRKQK